MTPSDAARGEYMFLIKLAAARCAELAAALADAQDEIARLNKEHSKLKVVEK